VTRCSSGPLLSTRISAGAVPHNYRFFRDRIYSKRHQLGDIENLRNRARESYETASRRIGRASDALRGKDHAVVRTATASLMGVGVGGDIGMLLAPASGQKKTCRYFRESQRRP
jgi:hypothetical protein